MGDYFDLTYSYPALDDNGLGWVDYYYESYSLGYSRPEILPIYDGFVKFNELNFSIILYFLLLSVVLYFSLSFASLEDRNRLLFFFSVPSVIYIFSVPSIYGADSKVKCNSYQSSKVRPCTTPHPSAISSFSPKNA
jgi:hypothetical protein